MYIEFRDYDEALLRRPSGNNASVTEAVETIIRDVRERGDEALAEYARRFDGSDLDSLFVSRAEIEEAGSLLSDELKDAMWRAKENIEAFHRAEIPEGEHLEVCPGVTCWRRIVPIQRIGLYIPGGTAPLFSTVLMLAVPARLAGCRDIMLATPAKNGVISPAILYAAKISGVDRILRVCIWNGEHSKEG